MSTSSATEAARQHNGRFGVQRRSEPDPANAGLETPEAPLPTWGEAVAHAEVLREQGVKVRVDEGRRLIEINGTNGKRHDLADGTPAWRGFYPDGTPEWVDHYTDGELVSEEWFPPPIGEA